MEQTDNQNGIVTGCDKNQEWILPWFWHFYQKHCSLPIAFADFGMTSDGRAWCAERGLVFDPRAEDRDMVEGQDLPAYVYKPFAIRDAPFRRALWLDADMMVCGDLAEAFLYCSGKPGACIDWSSSWAGYKQMPFSWGLIPWQGGAIVAERGDGIIAEWCKVMTARAGIRADDVALSYLLDRTGRTLNMMPLIFNTPLGYAVTLHGQPAIVIHFIGKPGKAGIKYMLEMGLDTPLSVARAYAGTVAERQRRERQQARGLLVTAPQAPHAQALRIGDGHADTGAGEG